MSNRFFAKLRNRGRSISGRALVFSLLLVAIAIFGFWLKHRDPFYSAPRALRNDMASTFLTTWDEYLTRTDPKVEQPAVEEFPPVQVLHYPKSQVVNLRSLPTLEPGFPLYLTAAQADSKGVAELPGGSRLRLVAMAVSVPRADDPLTPESDSPETLSFRAPDGSPISPEELSELGIPEAGKSVSRALRWFPMVRLVFQSENLAFHRISSWRAFDERTHANVTQALAAVPTDRPDLLILDTDLSIWHDTPILISIELPCGPPKEQALALEGQTEVNFSPQARFQLINVADGKIAGALPKGRAFHLPIEQRGAVTTFVHRTFPQTWATYAMLRVQRRVPDSEQLEERWLPVEFSPMLGLASVDWPKEEITSLSVVSLPHKARAIFRLPNLPEMPNPRSLKNLFDARIPRLYLPDEGVTSGQQLAYILLNIISGATETQLDHLTGTPVMNVPEDYWPKLFRDVSPRELVAEYQRYAVEPYLHLDRTDYQLRFHRPEPWTLKVEQWWYVHAPDWLK